MGERKRLTETATARDDARSARIATRRRIPRLEDGSRQLGGERGDITFAGRRGPYCHYHKLVTVWTRYTRVVEVNLPTRNG
ncbi:hypothetical protein BB347_05700 [Natronorubrum daqingense]|uniref:Uncharacterized protein n=1 Tax=Natronorubrum daqingense TaxID=588898 RepID=A0A1P8RC56_9EURY|nr:hypothetical protein BB347_05700 [Natronorubrum daqingense]